MIIALLIMYVAREFKTLKEEVIYIATVFLFKNYDVFLRLVFMSGFLSTKPLSSQSLSEAGILQARYLVQIMWKGLVQKK